MTVWIDNNKETWVLAKIKIYIYQHSLKTMTTLWSAGERKKGTKGETDRQTCSRKSLPARVWGYAANQAGIQLFTSADLLSIEIGCLPRRMR